MKTNKQYRKELVYKSGFSKLFSQVTMTKKLYMSFDKASLYGGNLWNSFVIQRLSWLFFEDEKAMDLLPSLKYKG